MKNRFHLLIDVPTSLLPGKPSVMKVEPMPDLTYNGDVRMGVPILHNNTWYLLKQMTVNLDKLERDIYLYDIMGPQIGFNIDKKGPFFINLTEHNRRHHSQRGLIQN